MIQTLLVTSTDLMMVQFLVPHIQHLSQKGVIIDIACSNVGNRMVEVRTILEPYVRSIFELRLRRSPLSLINVKGYKDLRTIFKGRTYDCIWTNEPVMSVATRLAARDIRRMGCKVLYMAHGFHFYRSAPLLNWCLFYPIERFAARFTDAIVCVNHEDFKRAQTFGVDSIQYIHGIGINTARLTLSEGNEFSIRKELNLKEDDFIVLSVGELNNNKNQKTIIRAIAELNNPHVHYLLCGKGKERENLIQLASRLGVSNQVHFLGYRKDVVNICAQSNVYAMPSFREGLPVSSLEAMYCGLPLITSAIRGLDDVNHNGRNGFLCAPTDYKSFAKYIKMLKDNPALCNEIAINNRLDVRPYTIERTIEEVENLFN